MKKFSNLYVFIVLFFLCGVGLFLYSNKIRENTNHNNPPLAQTTTQKEQRNTLTGETRWVPVQGTNNSIENDISEKESAVKTEKTNAITVILDVLNALDNYNFAISDTSTTEDITSWLTQLMNMKKRMQQGDIFVKSYVKDPDQFISTTALGMITGSMAVQNSTENLIQYLRKVDENNPDTYSDLQYQTAKFLSDNKEGFMLIAQSSPQVTALLWEPTSSKNPSGPIPYTVSKTDRQRVLARINELFEDDLKEYSSSTENFNSIIFAINAIKKNIEPDTYEQAEKNN